MMRLGTLPVFMEEGLVRVYWSTGLVKNGCVDVNTASYSKDVEVLAELIAIRHLLFHVQVFDRKPLWGSGIELTVASEEILHLFDRTSRKAHLYPYFRYVPACLEQIKICLKCPFVDEDCFRLHAKSTVHTVDGSLEAYKNPNEVWHTAFGDLFLTKHAVEQFFTRSEAGLGGSPKNPRAALLRLLGPKSSRFVRVELPVMVEVHKSIKYGTSYISEFWADPDTGMHLTIVKPVSGGPSTLVTVFFRPVLSPAA